MRTYYVAGLPYSDELYHHGIKGQKWGLRRFQNEDRTWTAAGKIRYGAGKVAEATTKSLKKTGAAVRRAAKATGSHVIKGIKRRHAWMMSDDELRSEIARIDLEKKYSDARHEINSRKTSTKIRNAIGGVLEVGGKKFAENIMTEFGKGLGKKMAEEASLSKEERSTNKMRRKMANMNARKGYIKEKKEYHEYIKGVEQEQKAEAKEKRDAAVNKAKEVSRKMKNGADYMRSNWSSSLYDDIPKVGYRGRETTFVQSIWSEPLDDAMKARTYL